ncbi:hypothetical protein BCON_0154g00270 [Botryotinia convoluta]|uniref:Uncharacterized protein n=1 Tax=Botryotinia convoluta TaxID=54673 RepID=A0A4Z1I5A8_9HELO|nr:hypothetical protein BCON_0154g00270 [Botryotinia convoluta]
MLSRLKQAREDGTMIRWILNNTYTRTISSGIGDGMRKRQTTVNIGGNGTMGGGGDNGFGGGGAAGLSGGTVLSQDIYSYTTDAEVCLVFLNVFSGEGADRTELRNTDQDILVIFVAAGCHNTVVIISTFRARIVDT